MRAYITPILLNTFLTPLSKSCVLNVGQKVLSSFPMELPIYSDFLDGGSGYSLSYHRCEIFNMP